MYTSYRLLQSYKKRSQGTSVESYANNDSKPKTTLDTIWLISIALLLVLDLILAIFGTYYAIRCRKLGRFPLWLSVVMIILLWIPTPLQPLVAVTMTIWGGSGCGQ